MDSTYALAYAGLGDAYLMLGVYSSLRPDESFPVGKMYAEKALQLDPSLAEAYATLIDIHIHYDWDADAAEKYFQRRLNQIRNTPMPITGIQKYLICAINLTRPSRNPERLFHMILTTSPLICSLVRT